MMKSFSILLTSLFIFSTLQASADGQNVATYNKWKEVPASVKKGVEQTVHGSWQVLVRVQKYQKSELPDYAKVGAEIATGAISAINNKTKSPQQLRVERLMNSLRPYTKDLGMRSCYQAHVMEADIINAINTGCHVFVTSSLAELLTDDELRGVIAHEVAHGEKGHLVKTYGDIFASVGKHFTYLIWEEIGWFLTGEMGPVNSGVLENGNWAMIMESFSAKAPQYEIQADQYGAMLLNRAKFSTEPMIRALLKLHSLDPDVVINPNQKFEGVRDYPSLNERIQAIQKVSKF